MPGITQVCLPTFSQEGAREGSAIGAAGTPRARSAKNLQGVLRGPSLKGRRRIEGFAASPSFFRRDVMRSRSTLAVFSLLFALAGCSKPGDPPTVDAGKDANGQPYVHVDGKQVDRNLEEANKNLKEAGRELKAGAEDAGAAIQRGAEEMN